MLGNTAGRTAVLVAAALAVTGVLSGQSAAAAPARAAQWTGAWSTAPQAPLVDSAPNWSADGFHDQTLRQVVRVSTGGPELRLRLSNRYGTTPLRITGATVGRAGVGATATDLRPVTFRSRRATTIAPGAESLSDPVALPLRPLESVTVSLYFAAPTGPATFHSLAVASSFRAAGDHRADGDGAAFTESSLSWYYLSGLDVRNTAPRDAVATFGDSITDGAASTVDAKNRYPDELAELLAARDRPRGVLNAGISGNRLLADSPCFGERGTARFAADTLRQPRVGTVVVLEGINDIRASDVTGAAAECFGGATPVTADQLIAGYRTLIGKAHAKGVRAVGATLLPYGGSNPYTPRGEAVRDAVNQWIRTAGAFDAVADLDRELASPTDPDALTPAFDSGDHLHPNDTGYDRMAEIVARTIR